MRLSRFTLCRSCEGRMSQQEWGQLLGNLVIGEAVALPITEEAEGDVRRIRLAPRLTPHVRHLSKYIDIPIPESRAFLFWRAHTAKEAGSHSARSRVSGHFGRPLGPKDMLIRSAAEKRGDDHFDGFGTLGLGSRSGSTYIVRVRTESVSWPWAAATT
jgi:hypothetical protein